MPAGLAPTLRAPVTLSDYIYGIAQLVHEYGLHYEDRQAAWLRGDGRAARIDGHVQVSNRLWLEIAERIELDHRGRPYRRTYSYYLVLDGEEFCGFDFDPDHPDPLHRHTRGHGRSIPDQERSLSEVLEMAWKVAEDEDFYAASELDVD